jgi:hypothetical protein
MKSAAEQLRGRVAADSQTFELPAELEWPATRSRVTVSSLDVQAGRVSILLTPRSAAQVAP